MTSSAGRILTGSSDLLTVRSAQLRGWRGETGVCPTTATEAPLEDGGTRLQGHHSGGNQRRDSGQISYNFMTIETGGGENLLKLLIDKLIWM